MPRNAIPCHAMPHHGTPRHTIKHCSIPHHTMPHHTTPHHATPPRHTTLQLRKQITTSTTSSTVINWPTTRSAAAITYRIVIVGTRVHITIVDVDADSITGERQVVDAQEEWYYRESEVAADHAQSLVDSCSDSKSPSKEILEHNMEILRYIMPNYAVLVKQREWQIGDTAAVLTVLDARKAVALTLLDARHPKLLSLLC